MKHYIFLLITLFLTSCSVVRNTYGDVTWYNDNGEMIGKWNNAVVHSKEETTAVTPNNTTIFRGLKNGGLNFIDNNEITHYISGGLIHITNIIEEPINEYDELDDATLASEYHKVTEEINLWKKQLKKSYNNETKYNEIKNRIERLKIKQKELQRLLPPEDNSNYGG